MPTCSAACTTRPRPPATRCWPSCIRNCETYPGGLGPAAAGRRRRRPAPYRTPAGELSFISLTAVVGTPMDVTVEELAIESFYPADDATAQALTQNQQSP